MSNDAIYWLTFSLLLVGAVAFSMGRLYERADRWLREWEAVRRARKATLAAREARLTFPKRKAPAERPGVAALARRIGRGLVAADDVQVWR